MERREHDIFMDMLANPTASFDTMVTVGLTSSNTSLQDRSVYEGNKYVQEHFKTSDGNFDKKKFEQAYITAKSYYNNLANADYNESMQRQTTWHRDSLLAPNGQRESGPRFQEFNLSNPMEQVYGFGTLGKVENPIKSLDELAQSHKVLANPTTAGANLENAIWEDAPNDNFFGNFFDTLVIAQWDEDGEHIDPITGEKVKHEKGEPKLNQNGEYYYEKLDGRDVYGRRVLNKMNVLTRDGSWANRFDPFDSDDIEQKSVAGSVFKNLALVGSMFIPYVGPWITGLSVATQLAGLGATLGKMALGSNTPFLNEIEGWSKSLNRQTAKTEYAQQHTWCWENFINLIGDVMGQLSEQRFIFNKIPAAVKGVDISSEKGYLKQLEKIQQKYSDEAKESILNTLKKGTGTNIAKMSDELTEVAGIKATAEMDSFVKGYNKLGEVLSMGYMTGITVADTYGEAKQAGASDLDATLLTLGYAAGEYALLNTGLGKWILPELRADKYKRQAIQNALLKLDNEATSIVGNASKEAKQSYIKRLFNIGKGIATGEYANGTKTLGATLAAGAGEGIEEVSEELLADFSKACYDTVKWLQGSDVRLNAFGYDFETGKWNGKDILDRYGMSLVGGAVGGSLTNIGTNYRSVKQLNNMTSDQAIQEIVSMYRNGTLDKFEQEIDKSQLADPSKSATDFEIKDGVVLWAPGTEENNQNLYAKRILHQQVKFVKDILDANGANLSDDSVLRKQTELLGDLRFNALYKSTTAGGIINEYNRLSSDIVKLTNKISNLEKSDLDSNKDGTVTDKEKRQNEVTEDHKESIKKLKESLNETKTKLKDLVEGKNSYKFVSDALFEMTTDLSGQLTTATFPLYTEAVYGRKYQDLTDNEKAVAWDTYKEWKVTEGRDKIQIMAEIYRKVSEQASKVIKKHADDYLKGDVHIQNFNNLVRRIFTTVDGTNESEWLSNAQDISNASFRQIEADLISQFGTEQEQQEIKNIIDRRNQMDPTMTEEERKQEALQMGKDFDNKLIEIMLRDPLRLVQPFINSGAINTETKNQLLNTLNQLTAFVDKRISEAVEQDDGFGEYMDSNVELDAWIAKKESLNKAIQNIERLGNTSFEKNLNEFSIAIGNDPINITQLHERLNSSFNNTANNITRFNMDEQLYKDLKNAIHTIEMYQAAIKGARTDNAGGGNYFGYNATLNEVAKKSEGDFPELAEIDKLAADVFIADINTNLSKLLFLKQLYELNQGQKLVKQDRISEKKDILIYKRLKSIVTVPDDDKLKSWAGFLEFKNTIDSAILHEKYSREESISESDKEDFEKENIVIQDAIYDFFQKNQDKLKDPVKLSEFVSLNRFQLYTEAKEILNEGVTSIDDNSMLWWIAGRTAIKASAFYNRYAQIIDGNLAPVPTQELAVYNNYANIVNGDVFSVFTEAFRQSMRADWIGKSVEQRKEILKKLNRDENMAADEYVDYALNILPVPRFTNIALTEGIAGSGKTSAVYIQTIALLKKFNPDLLKNVAIIHGASESSATELQNMYDIKDSKVYDKAKWMKEVSDSWKEPAIDPKTNDYLITKSDYCLSKENEIVSALGINQTDNPPSLVIIDEISKFSTYDLDLINNYAKKYGITVLAGGDFDQMGVTGSHPITINGKNLRWTVDLSRTSFIRSPKLGVSMRTDNSLKTKNQQKLQAYMQNPEGNNIEFEWFQDESGLFGDKIVQYSYESQSANQQDVNIQKKNDLNFIMKEVDKLIKTLKPNEKIGYIFNDKSSPIYQKLASDEYKNFIDLREGGSAQGLEGRYYIIEPTLTEGMFSDNPWIKANFENIYLKEIYTGITRAQQGSIVILPTTSIRIKSNKMHQKLTESVNPGIITAYATKRKELLSKITTSQEIAFKERTKETSEVKKSTEESKNGLDSGIVIPPVKNPIDTTTKEINVEPDKSNKILTPPETVELSTLSKEDQAELIKIQEEVVKNPETKDPWNINDNDSLYKYGQIVSVQGQYGVIKGIQLKSDGNHKYLIETKTGDEEIEYKDITQLISNSKIDTPVVLDHNEMVNRFGDIANIESITINHNGVDITLPLCQIPFETPQNETGTNNMINYYHRNIVVVKIGNVHVPFYMSTGSGGKKNVQPGLWYPFFGIKGDWLNKGTQEQINNFYGSPVLKAVAEQLNQVLGTGYVDEIRGPITIDEETIQLDYVNQDLNPTENGKSDTIEKFNNNVQSALETIDKSLSELTPEISGTEAAQLPYEGDEAPVNLNSDIVEDQTYQEATDKENELESLPSSNAEVNNSKISINMLLHSFNTFETGVLWDEQGNPVSNQDYADKRIDSVNGLLKIGKLGISKFVGKKKDYYLNVLGLLRSHLFNTEDKAELAKKLEKVLGLNGIYITFALKSSPRAGEGNRATGREFVENTPSPFSKGISESTEFNGSSDTRSHEWHPKSLVAIIGTKANGDVLELPLLALSSPFTLLQITDSNNNRVFQEVFDKFDIYRQQGLDYYHIAEKLVEDFQNVSKYEDLINLFKLFKHTDRNIEYIKDSNWTIARDLTLKGAIFAKNRGEYQGVPGFDYDADSIPEQEWTTLDDFCKDTQRYVSQQIFCSLNGLVEVNGKSLQVAKAGNPFVLVSYDRELNTDKDVVNYYIRQCVDPTLPKKVKQIYVIPPKATLEEYIENLHNIFDSKASESIGQFFTSFKLLKVLMQNDTFKEILEQRTPGILNRVQSALDYIQEALDAVQSASVENRPELMGEVKRRLFEPQNWSDLTGGSTKPVKLAGLLDSVLMNFIYTRNTLAAMLTDNGEISSELNRDNLNLFKGILNQAGINGIYYNIRLPHDASRVGPFVIVGTEHSLQGKPFRIHNKLDSYTFSGNMSELVKNYVDNLRSSKPNKKGDVHYAGADTYKYMKGQSKIDNTIKTKDEIDRQNLQNLFKQKGLNLTQILSESGLSEMFENQPIDQSIDRIINLINQQIPNRIAFKINGELVISDKVNELGTQTFILDSQNNPITDITPILNTFGEAQFKIRVNGIDYTTSYKDRKIKMTPPVKANENVPLVQLSITEDNFQEYLTSGREALQNWVEDTEDALYYDPDLDDLFHAQSLEEIQQIIDNMPYSVMSEEDLQHLINYTESEEFKALDPFKQQIVQEIIKLEQALQNQNYDETQEACPIDITFNV